MKFLESVPVRLLEREQLGAGGGVRVAVIDTGIESSHPDLKCAVTRSVSISMRRDGRARITESAPRDRLGHGTACADIIGRLAPQAQLWSIQVLDNTCRGDARAFIAALDWAVAQGAHVINVSLGMLSNLLAERMRASITAAYRKSIIVVAAANNRAQQSYPATFASIVRVDARYMKDPEDFRSGRGEVLVAPGVYVWAAWIGATRRLVSGTSFACPHIAGHVARILSANPGMRPCQVKTVLLAMALRNARAARERGRPGVR